VIPALEEPIHFRLEYKATPENAPRFAAGSNRILSARVALVLLVAGLVGYLVLAEFDADGFGTVLFAIAALLALLLGWLGRRRLPGKIAVFGVCLLVARCLVVYVMFPHALPSGGILWRPTVVEPDTRPAFVLDASKPFVIELGRGSGMYGLDVVKISQTGAVELQRIVGGQHVERASVQLSGAALTELVDRVNSRRMTSMGRSYSDPGMADGTQWVLWVQQVPLEKSIYFNNAFPGEITGFASRLDALLQNAGVNKASWTPLPKQQGIDEQVALWARIK